ncbi:FecR family protein [Amphiplicatus metriothermophilus]|uniref:FecR family protein n=1 Tax=Amphiplicatus metriothermophilus TaxID=1519374 RepID=A0A239PUZ5_9PROT|nr:FecR domain-containing protein [Amphiplicatus metriothermophilus]MBB5519557.1 transmembrane sensor [Amphiplicatus metriothermophilus]SNT74121.1 FecR family protein [Amphiplicatus metriothermophilus]
MSAAPFVRSPRAPEKAAAFWRARRLSDGWTPADEARFQAWLDEDPAHAAAYRRAERALAQAEGLTRYGALEPFRRAAREAASRGGSRLAAPGRALVAASLLLLVVAVGVATRGFFAEDADRLAQSDDRQEETVYATKLGEQRAAVLPDGSRIVLNTETRLRWAASGDERRVVLDAGQAAFDVNADPDRPFVVFVGDRKITVVGTQFDVRADGDTSRITLLEGRLSVESAAASEGAARVYLQPGEQFVSSPYDEPIIRQVNVNIVTAWRHGRLIFDEEPLEAAIAEVNRYSSKKLVLQGEGLDSFRISGVFRIGEPDAFAAALTTYFPIEIAEQTDSAVTIRKIETAR